MSGQVPPSCHQHDAPSTYSAKWDRAEPDSFHSGRIELQTSYTSPITRRRRRRREIVHVKTPGFAAYSEPHFQDCGVTGSCCLARSEGHEKQCAAKFKMFRDILLVASSDKSSNRSLTNSAAVARRLAGDLRSDRIDFGQNEFSDDVPTKTINKHFAAHCRSKIC